MAWLLAPAVGPALEPGLGALSRVSGGAAGASGGGAATSAGSGGAGPAAGSEGTGASVHDCRATSKAWQICICQVLMRVQVCSSRSSSCSSDTPNGSRPYRTSCNVSDLYHEREGAC
eukprot:9500040-Pyramimonas_sp.AAC.2